MSGSDNWTVGFLILTPIAILVIVVFGAIKLSAYSPPRWKPLKLWQKSELGHKRKTSEPSADSTATEPSVDLENGHRTEAK